VLLKVTFTESASSLIPHWADTQQGQTIRYASEAGPSYCISSVKKLDVYVLVNNVSVTVPAGETTVAVCVAASDTETAVAVSDLTATTTDLD
jgi:hypothetical protein